MRRTVPAPGGGTLTAPTVPEDAASKDYLCLQYREALVTVDLAVDALKAVSPIRSHYESQAAFETASGEHQARIDLMRRISSELAALALDVLMQGR